MHLHEYMAHHPGPPSAGHPFPPNNSMDIMKSRPERQASVRSVFGHATVAAAAHHFQHQWETWHPEEPLHPAALLQGLLADMNASLPEPFTIETPDARYVTGPDIPLLAVGWAATARNTFRAMDLSLATYTEKNVQSWRSQGNGGYPWPPILNLNPTSL